MLQDIDSYDWNEAWFFVKDPYAFERENVEEIIGISEGFNDGDPWIILARLKDKRWLYLTAGCDYTGWDCQSGGDYYIANNYRDIMIEIPKDHRRRMGLPTRWERGCPGCAEHGFTCPKHGDG